MYVLFGTKWCKIFSGPLWSFCPISQSSQSDLSNSTLDPIKVSNIFFCVDVYFLYVQALVNVPSLSERTIRRDIAGGKFTVGSEIQV